MAIDTTKIPGHEVWVRIPKGCFDELVRIAEANDLDWSTVLMMIFSHFLVSLSEGELDEAWGGLKEPERERFTPDIQLDGPKEGEGVVLLFRPASE